MKLKFLLPLLIPVVIATSAAAQDRIFQSNGNVIKAKVISVAGDDVVYKLWNHDDNREYTIAKSDVDKIKYEGGKQEWFNNTREGQSPVGLHDVRTMRRERDRMMFGNKVLSFAPLLVTDQGIGFSLAYEKAIDKEGIVSFNLPLLFSINIDNWNNNNYYSNYSGYYDQNLHQDAMVYFTPGIKFYPTGMFGKVKYAVGPTLVLGVGEQTTNYNYYAMPYTSSYALPYAPVTRERLVMGVMLSNSLNINPTPHFYMGLDYGFGFSYIDKVNDINQSQDMSGITQLSFKFGYRF